MRSLTNLPSAMSPLVLGAVLSFAIGIVAVSIRAFESDEAKAKRVEVKRQKEVRGLMHSISIYARSVHQRYPTGDVVVGESDLAGQLRKRPEAVVAALNLLLNEQKVHRAALPGYWKLHG